MNSKGVEPEELKYSSQKTNTINSASAELSSSIRVTDKFNNYTDYLNNITTDLDLLTDVKI